MLRTGVRKEASRHALAHGERLRAAALDALATSLSGIEMVLARSPCNDLSILGYLDPLCV